MDPQQELKTVEKGGLWSDENLDKSLDWGGERATSDPSVNQSVLIRPKSSKEQEREILNSADITQEVLNVIISKVSAQIAKNSGSDGETVVQVVESRLDEMNASVKKWVDTLSKRISELETKTKDLDSSQISRLDEKLASLETKIDTITSSVTQHGVEELEMIHEAHNIIMERKAVDEPDDSNSAPSVYNRLTQRASVLETQLKTLEPLYESSAQNIIVQRKSTVQAKKKFGKLF